MHIGLLTTSYPRRPEDFAGLFVAEMARALRDAGDRVDIVGPSDSAAGGWASDPLDPRGRVLRLAYAHRPRLFYGAGAPDNLGQGLAVRLQIPGFMVRLAAAVRDLSRRCTHLLSHWLLPCGLTASLLGSRRPHLAVAHSSDVHLLARLPGAALLLEAMARSNSRLLLTSETLRALLLDIRGLRRCPRAHRLVVEAVVMRMGIDPGPGAMSSEVRRASQQALGLGSPPTKRAVLFLGRLVPVKAVDRLVEAMSGLPGHVLWVAGDGPERPGLEQLALHHGVQARFFGPVHGELKQQLLGAADLMALPGRVLPDGRCDSAPRVLLEAMTAGLPVVAARVGGNAELLRDGENGLLVAPNEARALRQALGRLASEPGLGPALAKAAQKAAGTHTWPILVPKIRQILQNIN